MNKKNIKNHLQNKFEEWINSIDNHDLKQEMWDNAFITGGSIASLLLGEKVHDYDIYLKTKEATKHIAQYYVDKFNLRCNNKEYKNNIGYKTTAFVLDGSNKEEDIKEHEGWDWNSTMLKISEDRIKIIVRSDGIQGDPEEESKENIPEQITEAMNQADDISEEELERGLPKQEKKTPYRPIFLTPNAITLSDKIQIVIRFYGEPEKIHENYDFIHCTNYWKPSKIGASDSTLELNNDAIVSLMNKELTYQGSKYPICSIIRLRKFLKRDWHINAGQILKMAYQVSNLDLTDPVVLEDQLVGVDTMYFMVLIRNIENEMKKDKDFQITNEYFLSVIDKVFGES